MNSTSLKDIAKKLNVSITTVSKALKDHPDISQKRKKQILAEIERMNYVPNLAAQNLRSNQSRFIAVIITNSTNPYFSQVIRQIEETLFENGYYSIIFNNNEDPKKEMQLINEIRSIHAAGVILTPALGNSDSVKMLRKYKIPYVLAHRYLNHGEDNYVIADDEEAGYLAAKYLIEHRGTGGIYMINGNRGISSAENRFKGYQMALEESGRRVDEDDVWWGVLSQEDGYEIMRQIDMKAELPYSVLCYSDYLAISVLKYLHEHHIPVPGRVAVMGIDDIDLSSFTFPELTTVHIPKKELGDRCACRMLEMLKINDHLEKRIVLAPELVVRHSV